MFFSKNMVARKLKFQDFLLFSCIFLATKQTKTPTKPWSNSAMLTQSINKTQTTVRSKTQNQKYQNPNHGQIKAQNQKYRNPNHSQIKTQNQKYQTQANPHRFQIWFPLNDPCQRERWWDFGHGSLDLQPWVFGFWPWVSGSSTMGFSHGSSTMRFGHGSSAMRWIGHERRERESSGLSHERRESLRWKRKFEMRD